MDRCSRHSYSGGMVALDEALIGSAPVEKEGGGVARSHD